jgi:hypothetical protein
MDVLDFSETEEFADPLYGYSVQIPAAWTPQRAASPDAGQRLWVSTPNNSVLMISVERLPRAIAGPADFEPVGQDYVDPIVERCRQSFGLTRVLGEQKRNDSDSRSLRFWQGTSVLDESMASAMFISLHAVPFGSDLMVNIFYATGGESVDEVRAVDALMSSLALTGVPRARF